MTDFNVQISKQKEYAILRSQGYINNLGGEKIAVECEKLFSEKYNNLILNLERSPIVNSIGISILIEIIEKIITRNGRLAFCHLTPTIAKTFRIMGLLQYAEFYTDEVSAVSAFRDPVSKP